MQPDPGDGAVVRGVPEAEDAAVGGDEPVTGAAGRRRDAHDGSLQRRTAHGAVEGGGTEGEDAAVRADQPIATRRRVHGERLGGPCPGEVVRPLCHIGRQRADSEADERDRVPVCADGAHGGRDGGDRGGPVTRCGHGGDIGAELGRVRRDVIDGGDGRRRLVHLKGLRDLQCLRPVGIALLVGFQRACSNPHEAHLTRADGADTGGRRGDAHGKPRGGVSSRAVCRTGKDRVGRRRGEDDGLRRDSNVSCCVLARNAVVVGVAAVVGSGRVITRHGRR